MLYGITSLGQGTETGIAQIVADVPLVTEIHHVETPNSASSHGQKGVGETPTAMVPAAIANAVEDATDLEFRTLPLSPDRVLPRLVEPGSACCERVLTALSASAVGKLVDVLGRVLGVLLVGSGRIDTREGRNPILR